MNKQAELTRWTPRRLLSLLMALIMTLSLLPTAALAASDTVTITGSPTAPVFVGQESNEITATLNTTDTTSRNVRLKITVNQTVSSGSISTGDCTIQYKDTSGVYTDVSLTADATAGTITGYLDAGISSLDDSHPVSATFKLKLNKSGYCSYTVRPFEWDAATDTEGAPPQRLTFHRLQCL